MPLVFEKLGLLLLLLLGVSLASTASACEIDRGDVQTDRFVIARSSRAGATASPVRAGSTFGLAILEPYKVVCGDEDRLLISETVDLPAGRPAATQYVLRSEVLPLPSDKVLEFDRMVTHSERPAMVAWTDFGALERFLATGDVADRPSLKEVPKHSSDTGWPIWPYPVLSILTRQVNQTQKQIYRVLVPVFLPPIGVGTYNCRPDLPPNTLMEVILGAYWLGSHSIVMEIADEALQRTLIQANKDIAAQCAGVLMLEAFVIENPMFFRLATRQ